MSRPTLPTPHRIIIKLGSAVLAPRGELDTKTIAALAADIAESKTPQTIIVSSGAVASGFRALGLSAPPKTIVQMQAAAAVGQQRLMAAWAEAFAKHGITIAQVLLTGEDLSHRTRLQNARRTLEELLARGIIPIINENDSVSFDEIKLGDNDRLSALVASLLQADLLLILSSVQGLYAKGTSRPVPHFASIAETHDHIRTDTSSVGTGGMVTKVDAAAIVTQAGVPMIIAGGLLPNVISRITRGEPMGTLFSAAKATRSSRQQWLGHSAKSKGAIIVDHGAQKAILSKGASLLPSGITAIQGAFARGETVDLTSADAKVPFARGIAAYSSTELPQIRGKKSSQIAAILGYSYSDEAVHRNNMVILNEPKK